MECSLEKRSLIETEFWGVEVKSSTPRKVTPETGRAVHISQVALGQAKKKRSGSIQVQVQAKYDDESTTVLGTLSAENPQFSWRYVISKPFELSHDWPYGSVYLIGHTLDAYAFDRICKSPELPKKIDSDSDSDSDADSDPKFDPDTYSDIEQDIEDDSEDDSEDDKEIPTKFEPDKEWPSQSAAETPVSASKAEVDAPQSMALGGPTYPNKKRRLMVSPCRFGESGLTFANVMCSLLRGQTRVEKLLSELSDFSEDSRQLEAEFKKILRMIAMPIHKVSQRERFYESIKQVLELWELVENQIEQKQLWRVPQLVTTLSDYTEPVPSAWVVMSDWHDMAYKEILSIRDKHSCLLDRAYEVNHEECYKSNEGLLCKKRLNFLASSREDISSLPMDKCYKWVMNIKSFVSLEKCLASRNVNNQTESWNFTGQSKSNWRDEIYEQIVACRKMHSRNLDEAYSNVYGLETWIEDDNAGEFLDFLDQSLDFLGKCRADLVFDSKKTCREQLKRIKRFVKDSPKSVPAKQFLKLQTGNGHWEFLSEPEAPLTNWRDVAYEKLQTKAYWFRFLLHEKYKKQKETWSKEPSSVASLKKLDQRICRALDLYDMRRPGMSLFSSKDDYFELVDEVTVALYESKNLIKELQGGKEPEWDPLALIPKRSKLSHLQ